MHHSIENSLKFLLNVETYDFNKSNYGNWHKHSRAQLIFCDAGEALLETKKETVTINETQAIIVPNNLLHRLNFINAKALNCIYFNFEIPHFTFELIKLKKFTRTLFKETLLSKTSFKYFSSLMIIKRCLFDQVIINTKESKNIKIPRDRRLKKVCQTILTNINDDSSIRDIASKVGLSDRTLLRLSMAELRCSISQWRNEQRIRVSIELLSSNVPINMIHNKVGYTSRSAFISMFKKHTGLTPSKYKNYILGV